MFKRSWAGIFFGPGGSGVAGGVGRRRCWGHSRPDPGCGRFAPDVCAVYQQVAAAGEANPQALALLAASSPATVLDRIKAPTLLVQGEADSLFPLSEGDANARGIAAAGTPVKVVWYGGGHDGGLDETDRLRGLVLDWFGRYLKRDGSPPDTRWEITVPSATISSADSNPAPQVRVAPAEPGVTGPGGPGSVAVPLEGPPQPVAVPAGGSPAAVTSLPGLGSALGALSAAAGAIGGGGSSSNGSGGSGGSGGGAGGSLGLSALPGQTAVFTSAPFERTVQVVGASRVRLRVTAPAGSATLFAQLYDVAPGGSATLPEQLVSPVKLTGVAGGGTEVTVSLPAVVRDVSAGHRLRLVVSTTDQAYALPVQPAQDVVALAGDGTITVPIVATTVLGGDGGLGSLLPWALALLAAIAVAVAVGIVAARRAARSTADPALAARPARDRGARQALRRRVPGGQRRVVPGGARLGARPAGPERCRQDHDSAHAHGAHRADRGADQPVRPPGASGVAGAVTGGRVRRGARLPAARPGLENLRLFWGATGRPAADAHLDEALEIAGLGDDVHRRVKTYSQGMRQRLAIAQAMLGLPDLLVLDEPTNGLDPPQIREMREVLGRYAATGRTVVVSSHLLAEVEQTCDHVVVMHQGRLVAAGAGRGAGGLGDLAGRRRRPARPGGRGGGLARRRPRRGHHADRDHPQARRHTAQRAGAGARGRGARGRPDRAAAGPRRGLPGAGGGGLMPTRGTHTGLDAAGEDGLAAGTGAVGAVDAAADRPRARPATRRGVRSRCASRRAGSGRGGAPG